MRYHIINADDFGYSPSVNRGIIEGYKNGIVTSTSVLVDAVAAEEAAGLTAFPDLSVGLHFSVTDFTNVQVELEQQMARFMTIVGKRPDHVDTHKLYTSLDGFKAVLPVYAKERNITLREYSPMRFIDAFFGMHTGGEVGLAQLKAAIDLATDEYNELMCHIGYSDDYLRTHSSYNDLRETELGSICDPSIRQYITDKGLRLCNWRQVPR